MAILKTNVNHFGKEVLISGGRKLKFDNSGSVEVADEDKEQLLKDYGFMLFDPEAVVEEVKPKAENVNSQYVKNLESNVYDLQKQIKEIEAKIAVKEADSSNWAKLAQETEAKLKMTEAKLTEETAAYESKISRLEMNISLLGSTASEIKKLCEKSSFPGEEWSEMKKDDLIEYVLNKFGK